MMGRILLRRAYDPPSEDDGLRILVERLWPRGLSKERLAIDHWAKDVAPSAELRKWFNHQPERWDGFQGRYRGELDANPASVRDLKALLAGRDTCFIFAARDIERNSAVVLRRYLETPS